MKFSEIKEIALSLPQYFALQEYRDHNYNKIERIELLFTEYGDYCGNTINKSNYHVLLDQLLAVSENIGNIKTITSHYSTNYIVIIGGIKNELWQVINDAIESLENYPILDDMAYSYQEHNDCLTSWYEWQYRDVTNDLKRNYDIDLDDDIYQSINDSDKLLNFLDTYDFFDRIENTEENAFSHWYIRDRNIADIATLITSKFINSYV
ncbi:MAG: hypothetical protein RLZZ171_1204 [Cyanobacteriota bacterium]|jgi:hypothetical protein